MASKFYENAQSWIGDKVHRHPIAVLGIALGAILFFSEGVKKIRYAETLLQDITNAGLIKPVGVGDVQLRLWFANSLFGLVLLLVFTAALCVQFWLSLKDLQQSQLKRGALVTKTLEGMIAASLKIRNQLTADKDRAALQLCLVEITYVIRKNADVNVTKLYHVKAAQGPVHFWEFPIRVDDLALEAEYLDTIAFKVKDESKRDVAYLPMRNESRFKAVVLYFLPVINENEPNPRIIKVDYCWPGLANSLVIKRRDNWGWSLESFAPIPKVKVTFLYEDLGEEVDASVVGSTGGVQVLKPLPKNASQQSAWEYTITDAPSAKYMVELRFKSKTT